MKFLDKITLKRIYLLPFNDLVGEIFSSRIKIPNAVNNVSIHKINYDNYKNYNGMNSANVPAYFIIILLCLTPEDDHSLHSKLFNTSCKHLAMTLFRTKHESIKEKKLTLAMGFGKNR
ncbi:CLUMA_CG006628, isoform A [Clunio marinus]|uniref:CLUMA_CG006628, isoform A n=1 Tax=Clunio marinus TaxID=568069 RepID=A0A1J1HYT8_9DIPT|nr:CLUMA_CG006628, isoform A [Clunio marinus]